jgi:predicted RND superfamily exporter protein
LFGEKYLERLFLFVEKHNKAVLLIILAVTVFMGTLIPRLHLDTDYLNLLPPNPEQAAIKKEILGSREKFPNDLYFMVEGDTIYEKETLDAIEVVLAQLQAFEEIGNNLSPFSFFTIQKKGTRLATVPMSPHASGTPWTEEEAETFRERLLSDKMMRGLLCSPDGDALMFYFEVANLGSNQEAFDTEITSIVHQLDSYANVYLIGNQLFEDRLSFYISHDFTFLLAICLVVILILYYLSFRAKRAVLIPFSLSLVGIIWTLGTMTLLGYSLTIVNIITPSMVLILGSSYSIHVISEYFRSFSKNNHIGALELELAQSLGRINKTIIAACLTTVMGFLSLLSCQILAFKELGIAVSLGISYCAILSLTYIPAWLSITPLPKTKQMQVFKNGILPRAVKASSRIVVRFWWVFLIILMLVIFGYIYTQDKIAVKTDYMSYYPPQDQLIRDAITFAKKMGGTDPHYITLTAPEGETGYFYRPEILQQVYAFEQALVQQDKDINHILSFSQYVAFLNYVYSQESKIPDSPGLILMLSRLMTVIRNQAENANINAIINKDATKMTITVRYYDSAKQSWQSVNSVRNLQQAMADNHSLLPKDISVLDWGVGVEGTRLTKIIIEDQKKSMIISFLLVFIIVCIQFHSVLYGIFAIIPILTGVMGNYVIMYLLEIPFDVVTSIFASVTVGTGVDNAIHFLVRFNNRKKRHPNQPLRVIIEHTLQETGRPITLTSSSIILGMLVLTLASFAPIQYFGLLLALALLTTTLSTLFTLPSCMIAIHKLKRALESRNRKKSLQ